MPEIKVVSEVFRFDVLRALSLGVLSKKSKYFFIEEVVTGKEKFDHLSSLLVS
jgi:hypothetical protein